MFSQYRDMIINKDEEGLKGLIEKSNASQLAELILPRISHDDAPKILDEILNYIPSSEAGQTTRRKFVEGVLKTIKKSQITGSHANSLVNRIVQDFPKYSKLQLVKLVDYCLSSIRNNDDDFYSWKDILPLLLQVLEDEKYINYKGSELTGTQYKSQIVRSICNQPWDPTILTPLTKMFSEIPMESVDHTLVIRAICDKVPEINYNEIPPLVHQLLKLSKNQDCKLVINTLQQYFSNLYAQAPDESPSVFESACESIGQVAIKDVQDTESTVLYHIRQSVSLNHSSLKDFLRNLKVITNAPEYILNPFPMSVLLLVTDIYEDQIFDIIKLALARKIQDDEKRKSVHWLREILPSNLQPMDIINQIIDNSTKDRHLVLRGLVDLAFVLLETKSKLQDTEEDSLHDIGNKILQKLIKKRHEIGSTVLQSLTKKIIAGGTVVTQFTECLSYMCRKMTLIVLDSQVWITTLLEQLLSIPGESATQVLLATLPLIRVSTSIRDTLVLILRKALYRKGVQTRQMAITGFLQFLMNLKITPFSLSQTSTSTTSSTSSSSMFTQATIERGSQRPNPRHNAAFCHEILSILARCLCHQAEVRQHLYKGLCAAVSMNPELAEHVIDMLMSHFLEYYETDEAIKPAIKFNACCNINGSDAILVEPIGDLLFALQKIYCEVAHKELASIDKLSIILESLSRRMAITELEDLNLDDNTDLLADIPKAQQKVHSLKLIIVVLETLIAYRINSWSPHGQNIPQNITSLFKSMMEMVNFSKKVTKPKKAEGKNKKDKNPNDTTFKKPRGRQSNIKLLPTIMDIQTMRKMICLLYDDQVAWATKEQAAVLKKRIELHYYALKTCVQIFNATKQLPVYERKKHQDKFIKDYIDMGEIIYKKIICDFDTVRAFDEETAISGLECFRELCDLMATTFSNDLDAFFTKICGDGVNLITKVSKLISTLQVLIQTYYDEELGEQETTRKIPLTLFEIIAVLINKISFNNTKLDKIFEWLREMSKSNKTLDPSIAVIILQLMTFIEEHDMDYGKTLDEMSLELCKKQGTIDTSVQNVTAVYTIINENTITQTHTVFSNALKNKLNNAAWALGRLKAEQTIANTSPVVDELYREQIKNKERCLCKQLLYTISTLEYVANVAISPGPNTEMTFKNLHQLYSIINALTKYFTSKSTQQNPAFQHVRFTQLVELAGKGLKTTFYNLITYMEENQHGGRKADGQALRNKVLKETKFIPKVVYEVEQFQKEILALSKKTGIHLETHIKHSITRDFRIKQPELVEGLERLDITQMMSQNTTRDQTSQRHIPLDSSDLSDVEESDSTDYNQPSKRPRRDSS
ncbi:Fanconi anemia group I protein [Microplitis demolitor]|uniref:Fanconi anemia group I protein n=1 Tax=Microplitis demolitor TaxID=69319 RepID=UPI0004CDBA12|nr:Fanconi anemia group I protein [Microplitis demolitor]